MSAVMQVTTKLTDIERVARCAARLWSNTVDVSMQDVRAPHGSVSINWRNQYGRWMSVRKTGQIEYDVDAEKQTLLDINVLSNEYAVDTVRDSVRALGGRVEELLSEDLSERVLEIEIL